MRAYISVWIYLLLIMSDLIWGWSELFISIMILKILDDGFQFSKLAFFYFWAPFFFLKWRLSNYFFPYSNARNWLVIFSQDLIIYSSGVFILKFNFLQVRPVDIHHAAIGRTDKLLKIFKGSLSILLRVELDEGLPLFLLFKNEYFVDFSKLAKNSVKKVMSQDLSRIVDDTAEQDGSRRVNFVWGNLFFLILHFKSKNKFRNEYILNWYWALGMIDYVSIKFIHFLQSFLTICFLIERKSIFGWLGFDSSRPLIHFRLFV